LDRSRARHRRPRPPATAHSRWRLGTIGSCGMPPRTRPRTAFGRGAVIGPDPLPHPTEQASLPLDPPSHGSRPLARPRIPRRFRSHGRGLQFGSLADRMPCLPAAHFVPAQGANNWSPLTLRGGTPAGCHGPAIRPWAPGTRGAGGGVPPVIVKPRAEGSAQSQRNAVAHRAYDHAILVPSDLPGGTDRLVPHPFVDNMRSG